MPSPEEIAAFTSFETRIPKAVSEPGYDDVPRAYWEDGHDLATRAFTEDFEKVDKESVELFVGMFNDFRHRYSDPNYLMVRGRVNPQLFLRPIITTALYQEGVDGFDQRLVGLGFSADAISGDTQEEREFKAKFPFWRNRWISMIAVDPEFQGNGLGSTLAMQNLRYANPLQPATAFTYPRVSEAGSRLLQSIGMAPTSNVHVQPFGSEYGDVEMVGYRHRFARVVAHNIRRNAPEERLEQVNQAWENSSAIRVRTAAAWRDHNSSYGK